MSLNAVGEQVIGNTFKFRGTIANDTVTYTDKDAFGAKFTITDAFRSTNAGFIQHIRLTCDSPADTPDLTLFVFDTDIGTYVNNASFAVTDTEMRDTALAHFDFASTDWRPTANNSIITQKGLGCLVKSLDSNLYCQFMIRSATTMTASSSVRWLICIAPD